MRLTLAGVRRGRRVIVWSGVLKFAAVVVPLPALITGLVFRLVTQLWSLNAFLLGLAAGGVIVVLVVAGALCTEMRKMPVLHDPRLPPPA